MNTSPNGLDFIAAHEGFIDHVYRDIAGIETIGFGHVLRPGDPITVTRDQALEILAHDVASAEHAVNTDVTADLTQDAFDALVSFTFNLGTGALKTSTLLTLLNEQGITVDVAKEFLRWCHARVNGQLTVVEGLYQRRIDEAVMFLSMQASREEALKSLGVDDDDTLRSADAVATQSQR